MTKYAKKKRHLTLAMRIRELIGYLTIGFFSIMTFYKMDTGGNEISLTIATGLTVLAILIYIFGILYCNYPNPLCHKTAEGKIADSVASRDTGLDYRDIPDSWDVYIYRIEYTYRNRTHTRLVKLTEKLPSGKRPIVKVCPFLPFLIHISHPEKQ